MAASYADLGQIARSDEFQRRISIAMNSAAANVYSEDSSVTGHAARAAFANKVATGNYNLPACCLAVLSQSGIFAEAELLTMPGNGIADTDLQFTVNTLWDLLSGA